MPLISPFPWMPLAIGGPPRPPAPTYPRPPHVPADATDIGAGSWYTCNSDGGVTAYFWNGAIADVDASGLRHRPGTPLIPSQDLTPGSDIGYRMANYELYVQDCINAGIGQHLDAPGAPEQVPIPNWREIKTQAYDCIARVYELQRQGRLPPDDVLRLLRQIGRNMEAAAINEAPFVCPDLRASPDPEDIFGGRPPPPQVFDPNDPELTDIGGELPSSSQACHYRLNPYGRPIGLPPGTRAIPYDSYSPGAVAYRTPDGETFVVSRFGNQWRCTPIQFTGNVPPDIVRPGPQPDPVKQIPAEEFFMPNPRGGPANLPCGAVGAAVAGLAALIPEVISTIEVAQSTLKNCQSAVAAGINSFCRASRSPDGRIVPSPSDIQAERIDTATSILDKLRGAFGKTAGTCRRLGDQYVAQADPILRALKDGEAALRSCCRRFGGYQCGYIADSGSLTIPGQSGGPPITSASPGQLYSRCRQVAANCDKTWAQFIAWLNGAKATLQRCCAAEGAYCPPGTYRTTVRTGGLAGGPTGQRSYCVAINGGPQPINP